MSLEWWEELAIENLAEENDVSIEYIKENIEKFVEDIYAEMG